MKQSKHHGNAENGGARLVPVRFEYFHPTARTVCVAGTFNDWNAESKPMRRLGDGHWMKETALRAGTYQVPSRSGRTMGDRSFGQGNRTQPVRREKLDASGGVPAGSSAMWQPSTFTMEKGRSVQGNPAPRPDEHEQRTMTFSQRTRARGMANGRTPLS